MRWFHRLMHRLSWQRGRVVSWYAHAEADEEVLMIGFECIECGEVIGCHVARRGKRRG